MFYQKYKYGTENIVDVIIMSPKTKVAVFAVPDILQAAIKLLASLVLWRKAKIKNI